MLHTPQICSMISTNEVPAQLTSAIYLSESGSQGAQLRAVIAEIGADPGQLDRRRRTRPRRQLLAG
jgi:hypothetical protein